MEEGNPGADGMDMNFGEVGGDFAAHSLDVEMFNEDSAGITTSGGQAEEAACEVVIFDAADETAGICEGFGDGVIKGHALFARVEGRGAKGAVKAARCNGKMTGIGLHEAYEVTEIAARMRMRKLIGSGSNAGRQPGSENAQRVQGKVHS